MPALILLDESEKSPVQFIHNRPDQLSETQKSLTFMVEAVEEAPKVKPYQIARLYGSLESQTHWWEIELKTNMTPYEFLGMIPAEIRCDLRYTANNDDPMLYDALEMIKLSKEVDVNSDEAQYILTVLNEDHAFTI